MKRGLAILLVSVALLGCDSVSKSGSGVAEPSAASLKTMKLESGATLYVVETPHLDFS